VVVSTEQDKIGPWLLSVAYPGSRCSWSDQIEIAAARLVGKSG
jgi:hypothetical protein|tara:strand:- start:1057 stop:1185 length:129 start_codon:yes stop_codon:yes gene_type:complete